MTYKITIEIKARNLTKDDLKTTSRQLSDAVEKLGFDHSLVCHIDKFRKFKLVRNTHELSGRLERALKGYKLR